MSGNWQGKRKWLIRSFVAVRLIYWTKFSNRLITCRPFLIEKTWQKIIHTYIRIYIYIEREMCIYIHTFSLFFCFLTLFLSFFLFSYVCPCFCFCFYFVWFSSAVIHITSSCLCCSYSCFQRIDCPFCIEVYRLRIWCSISLLSACVSKSRSLGFGSLTSPNFLD